MELSTAQRRTLLVSAIGYAVLLSSLIFVAVLAPLHADTFGLPASEVAAEYVAAPGGFITEDVVALVALSALLVFAAQLSTLLRAAPDGSDVLARTALAGAVALVVMAMLVGALRIGAVTAAGLGVDPGVLLAFDEVGLALGAVSAFPTVVFLASGSLGLLRTGIAARWIGWLGLVAAGGFALGVFTLYDRDGVAAAFFEVGAPLHLVWVVAVGVSVFRRSRGAAITPAPAPAVA